METRCASVLAGARTSVEHFGQVKVRMSAFPVSGGPRGSSCIPLWRGVLRSYQGGRRDGDVCQCQN
eukprot:4959932-Lingulodinium_polyedra.AAC.1